MEILNPRYDGKIIILETSISEPPESRDHKKLRISASVIATHAGIQVSQSGLDARVRGRKAWHERALSGRERACEIARNEKAVKPWKINNPGSR